MSQLAESIEGYYKNMTAGKFVLCPHEEDAALVDGAVFPEFDIQHLGTEA